MNLEQTINNICKSSTKCIASVAILASAFLGGLSCGKGGGGGGGGGNNQQTPTSGWIIMRTTPNPEINSIAIDQSDLNIIYAGTTSELHKSTDGGINWTVKNNGIPSSTNITNIRIDPRPRNSDHIYISTMYGDIFESRNGGDTFSKMIMPQYYLNNFSKNAFVIGPPAIGTSGELLYAVSMSDFYKNDIYTNTWNRITGPNVSVSSLAVSPIDGLKVYAGTYNGSIFKSSNGGTTWTASQQKLSGLVRSLTIDPINPSIIYAGTEHIYKSIDDGVSWTIVKNNLTRVYELDIDPSDPMIIYACTYGLGIFKSKDGGSSWNQINNGLFSLRVNSLDIFAPDTKILCAGTELGAYKSTNGGE